MSLSVFHLRRAGGPGLRTGGRKLEAVGSGAVADEGGRGPRSAAGSLSDPSPLRFVTTAKGQREAAEAEEEDEDEPPSRPSAASDVASSTTPRWFAPSLARSLGLKTSAVEWSFPLLPSLFHSFVPFGKGESGERRRVSERASERRMCDERDDGWMRCCCLNGSGDCQFASAVFERTDRRSLRDADKWEVYAEN